MTVKTEVILYSVVALLCYLAWLVALSVELHRAELKLTDPVKDQSFYIGFGLVTSILWPLSLVVVLCFGIVFAFHELIGHIVRRVTRGKRAAETLRKAS